VDTEEKVYLEGIKKDLNNLNTNLNNLKIDNQSSHQTIDKKFETMTQNFCTLKESFIDFKARVEEFFETKEKNENRKWRVITAVFGGAVIIVAILEIVTRF